jgi:D-galactarolactone isomerase
MIARRTFIKRVSMATIASTTLGSPVRESYAQEVPNSSGTEQAKLRAPAGACDCHHHIYDASRFPPANPASRMQPNAGVAEYRLLQRRIGTARNVIVPPAAYDTDNRVTLDAIKLFGPNARGVAVVRPTVTDGELNTMSEGGIRGIRFTLFDPTTAVTTADMIEPLSKRVAALGWHLQIHMRGDQIVEAEELLNRLPAVIVFDHMGRVPQPARENDRSYKIIRRLIDKGAAWVKLSGAYLNTEIGAPYPDASALAQAYVKAAPERMVWGSDWPHPTQGPNSKPNDAMLFDLLGEWAPEETTRHRILVENPETLYGFQK